MTKYLRQQKDNEISYFVDEDLEYRDTLESETRSFPLCPEKVNKQFFTDFWKKIMPEKRRPENKSICDWKDKNISFTQFRSKINL